MAAPHFLVHAPGDSVGVAVMEIAGPQLANGVVLQDDSDVQVETKEAIPLGHKIALIDLAEGSKVIEYGEVVAKTIKPITVGEHVHVHNVRSVRWDHA